MIEERIAMKFMHRYWIRIDQIRNSSLLVVVKLSEVKWIFCEVPEFLDKQAFLNILLVIIAFGLPN